MYSINVTFLTCKLYINHKIWDIIDKNKFTFKFLHGSLVKCASRFLAVAVHVHIYNVLMHSHFSWWMRRNPHGFALSVINLQHSTNSSLMGKTFSLYIIMRTNWIFCVKCRHYLKSVSDEYTLKIYFVSAWKLLLATDSLIVSVYIVHHAFSILTRTLVKNIRHYTGLVKIFSMYSLWSYKLSY